MNGSQNNLHLNGKCRRHSNKNSKWMESWDSACSLCSTTVPVGSSPIRLRRTKSGPNEFLRYECLTLCKMTLTKIMTGFTYPKGSGSWWNKAQQGKKLNYSLHKRLCICALLSSQKRPIRGVFPLSSLISSIICSVLWSISVLSSETNSACHQFPALLVNAPFLKAILLSMASFFKALYFKYMLLSTLAGKEFYKYI